MAEQPYDLVTIGGSTFDVVIPGKDALVLEEADERYIGYPYARKLYMEQIFLGFGGGASNVAVAAARLGLKVSFVGAIGNGELAQMVKENFQRAGVDTAFIKQDSGHETGVSIVLTAPDGERTILLHRGANSYLGEGDINWLHCQEAKWIFISSLSGESDVLYNKVAATARENGTKLAINPGATQISRGTRGMHEALSDAYVVMLNEEEARELLRQRGKAGGTVPEMLRTLQKINQGIAVITKGPEGVEADDGKNHYALPAFGESRVNTLGAGDAFSATFVASLIKGGEISEALRYASINASAAVSDYAAQSGLLNWEDLVGRAKDNTDFTPEVTPRTA